MCFVQHHYRSSIGRRRVTHACIRRVRQRPTTSVGVVLPPVGINPLTIMKLCAATLVSHWETFICKTTESAHVFTDCMLSDLQLYEITMCAQFTHIRDEHGEMVRTIDVDTIRPAIELRDFSGAQAGGWLNCFKHIEYCTELCLMITTNDDCDEQFDVHVWSTTTGKQVHALVHAVDGSVIVHCMTVNGHMYVSKTTVHSFIPHL